MENNQKCECSHCIEENLVKDFEISPNQIWNDEHILEKTAKELFNESHFKIILHLDWENRSDFTKGHFYNMAEERLKFMNKILENE